MTILTTLPNNGTFSSNLATSTEEDDIGVSLLAGFAYQFDIFGQGSLTSPGFTLNTGNGAVYNSSGIASGHYRITYTPSTNQTDYLAIFGGPGSYTVTSAPADDFTNNATTTGTLVTGGAATGTLQTVADTDYFRVTLSAHFAYQFDIQGQSPLNVPAFTLNAPNGAVYNSVSLGTGHYRITYTPSADGVYYLGVSGNITGSYSITSAPSDDYTDDPSTTGTVPVGGVASGALQTVADTDAFNVTLTKGVVYHFDIQGQGTLTVPAFTLNAPNGAVYNSTNVGPGHYRITFTPATGGVYQLKVSGNTTGSYTITSAPLAPADFSADGKSDLVLENNDGSIVILNQANLGITAGVAVGNPGPTWHVIASADLSGDGHPDLLLQNNNGAIVDYLMNGTAVASGNYLGNAGASWHVRGAADFNGDGNADILLQNDNGGMVIWTTNGASVTGTASIGNPGPSWTIEGVADFNADGQPDILLQNMNGGIVDYLMNGTSIASGNYLGNPGAGWSIAGTGDYNGDGYADILLHNDNGADVLWSTNGTTVIGTAVVGNPGASYTGSVAGVDLDNDGEPDLVVQKTDGTLVGYTLNNGGVATGSAVFTGSALLGSPGAGWHAIGSNPMEFIDGTHGQASLVATPGPDQFDFTTFTGGLQQIAGFNPAQDSLALSVTTVLNYAGVQGREYAYQGGTLIELAPSGNSAAVLIQGITPGQLTTANFVLR